MMLHIKIIVLTASTLVVLLLPNICHAGGFGLSSPTLNDLSSSSSVIHDRAVKLCYNFMGYIYSGHSYENTYIVFMIAQNISLKGSVGINGDNNPEDIRTIKQILNDLGYFEGFIDSDYDNSLTRAIQVFQRDIGITPDSRIDKHGRTHKSLIERTGSFFLVSHTKPSGSDYNRMKNCINFVSPRVIGKYSLYYYGYPLITRHDFSYLSNERNFDNLQYAIHLPPSEVARVKRFINEYSYFKRQLIEFDVDEEIVEHKFAIYLKLNGKIPALESIKPGIYSDPVTFSWFSKPNDSTIEYRYRLYPDGEKWSDWSPHKETDYFYILKGSHTFEVQGRYTNKAQEWVELPKTTFDFFITDTFIAKPRKRILKASRGRLVDNTYIPSENDIYSRSKAILIGITEYSDLQNFTPLDYVANDISVMEKTLVSLGFDSPQKAVGNISSPQASQALNHFINSANENERLVIYISSHGFQDKNIRSKAYIASSDCFMKSPEKTCVNIDLFNDLSEIALKRKVKHLLIIIDSCSSGLGIIDKGAQYYEQEVASNDGIHMMTAGLASQDAQMVRGGLNKSVFTHFLTEGLLSSDSDYTNDGVISLSELLVYTRYKVAEYTHGAQTPMIGRLKGTGEMFFDVH
jgi:peptidoglycan hydrolase-like protein with peptidoglycan-binding domain